MDNFNKSRSMHFICPACAAGLLDNSLRKLAHNPQKILKPYIRAGMTVLDVGCGSGFFSREIAKMLNGSGKVIAADVQEKMLDKVRRKIKGTNLEQTVELHKCGFESLGIAGQADFVLAFWVVHEMRNQENFFKELSSIPKPGGLVFIAEPKIHVSKKEFGRMIDKIKESGFKIVESPKVLFSRSVVLSMGRPH